MYFQICSASRGEFPDRNFRQLERVVRTQTVKILINVSPNTAGRLAAVSCSCPLPQ
jgi:hypothetical protein